jgi:hypothetical protein
MIFLRAITRPAVALGKEGCSMNTRFSGSARVDDIKSHPHEIRGLTKLVKITEDVRKFAAERGITDDAAIEEGLKQKAKEFKSLGSAIYADT